LDVAYVTETGKYLVQVFSADGELLVTTNDMDYLQLYSPVNRETLAIGPMTCPANAFNNREYYLLGA
ncbi:MAG: galactose mutarotase-like enzyme, partial [Paraglaciecola sp.]